MAAFATESSTYHDRINTFTVVWDICTMCFSVWLLMLDSVAVYRTRHDKWGTKYRQGQPYLSGPLPGPGVTQELDTIRAQSVNNVGLCQQPNAHAPLGGDSLDCRGIAVDTLTPYSMTNVHELSPAHTTPHRYELGTNGDDWTASRSRSIPDDFPPTASMHGR
ncbi:hypothetical protein BDD12DRAFT_880117 [Trichophaea hybrida]|nr:hypothetical protein BDD12DRAFT_880117 [Trichophaea hybrida]